ncbi:TPA: ABC transporter substrate-binding protein [Burkholderia cepacia]|uniref:ABC transporter substrate-binding protein n=1 Tax=Burkholderia cepacia TaxID=292 RepID=UPI001CF5305A|nr:ABC transporter substrate-binding protein [Burkholderia cepacia]MCA8359415.1 ABC transporter substrate-binding protein [Burkholderia cepacia]HDR9758343.1 ABC transporter substrate-binding protein [Burkholderia cepacia ATCC 25416]HDV6366350.1 ABC transporter substrate-binding protein [Burkholderia cepacia]
MTAMPFPVLPSALQSASSSAFRRLVAATLLGCAAAHAGAYPVTVRSCDRDVTFDRAPTRAVSNDVNLTEMMLVLGLKDRLVGYTGIGGWKTGTARVRDALRGVPELASQYPSLEVLAAARADFYLAGWNYGMHVGGAVTPATLAPFGIRTYELTESCSHVMKQTAASFDDVFRDLNNLGRIFGVDARAAQVVAAMRARLAAVSRAIGRPAPLRVFVYDSGTDKPMTAGALAMPTALLTAAGARNVMADLPRSWTQVSWESVVARDPQVIVIVDYSAVTVAQKQQFLLSQPSLARVAAIRDRRFIVIPYDAATPGPENVAAVETLARALYPAAFAGPAR